MLVPAIRAPGSDSHSGDGSSLTPCDRTRALPPPPTVCEVDAQPGDTIRANFKPWTLYSADPPPPPAKLLSQSASVAVGGKGSTVFATPSPLVFQKPRRGQVTPPQHSAVPRVIAGPLLRLAKERAAEAADTTSADDVDAGGKRHLSWWWTSSTSTSDSSSSTNDDSTSTTTSWWSTPPPPSSWNGSSSSSSSSSSDFYAYDYNDDTNFMQYGRCAPFNTSFTSSASQNYHTCTIQPPASDHENAYERCAIALFTCDCTGDTYLRVHNRTGEMGTIDDQSDGGSLSCSNMSSPVCSVGAVELLQRSVRNPPVVQIRQGCYGSGQCSGQVQWFYTCQATGADLLSAAPPPPPYVQGSGSTPSPPPPTRATLGGSSGALPAAASLPIVGNYTDADGVVYIYAYNTCASYSLNNTYSASVASSACSIPQVDNYELNFCSLWVYDCGCTGDQYVSLLDPRNMTVIDSFDDDESGYCASDGYRCSTGYVQQLAVPLRPMRLSQGCFGSGSCTGAMTWYIQCTAGVHVEGGSAPAANLTTTPPAPAVAQSSTSTDEGVQLIHSYGACTTFELWAGTNWPNGRSQAPDPAGVVACDILLPQLPASITAATCLVYFYACGCLGDTLMKIPSLNFQADDDELNACSSFGGSGGLCSSGMTTLNYTASASRRLRLEQSCYSTSGCSSSTSWGVSCSGNFSATVQAIATASVLANASAGSEGLGGTPPTPASFSLSQNAGDYDNTIPEWANAVGIYSTFTLIGSDRSSTFTQECRQQFGRGLATSLSTAAVTVTAGQIFVLDVNDFIGDVVTRRRRMFSGSAAPELGVSVPFSVLAKDPYSAALILNILATAANDTLSASVLLSNLNASGLTGISALRVSQVPYQGAPIVVPGLPPQGQFNTSSNPLPEGALVFGSYPPSQCLQARAGALFLKKDSLSLQSSAAAFALTITTSSASPLAIGFYVSEDGESSLEQLTEFFVVKQNSSTLAYPRVSAIKKKRLKPYTASLNQVVAMTTNNEDHLYMKPQWILKLDRMELHEQRELTAGAPVKKGAVAGASETTLVFHPFYFNFIVPGARAQRGLLMSMTDRLPHRCRPDR
jgi:hypothetical protein